MSSGLLDSLPSVRPLGVGRNQFSEEALALGPLPFDAAMAKAKLLHPTQPEQDDPNIAAALAAAAGTSPAPQSLSDRLAALRARGAD